MRAANNASKIMRALKLPRLAPLPPQDSVYTIFNILSTVFFCKEKAIYSFHKTLKQSFILGLFCLCFKAAFLISWSNWLDIFSFLFLKTEFSSS